MLLDFFRKVFSRDKRELPDMGFSAEASGLESPFANHLVVGPKGPTHKDLQGHFILPMNFRKGKISGHPLQEKLG